MSLSHQIVSILGGQWGDEGKGKIVDILAEDADIIARAAGGANAGHTVLVGDQKFVFHLLPSGVLHPGKVCILGTGMVIHLPTLFEELKVLEQNNIYTRDTIKISSRAHILFDFHQHMDSFHEHRKGNKAVGTTKRGIGPAYEEKARRTSIRVVDLLNKDEFLPKIAHVINYYTEIFNMEIDEGAVIAQYLEYAEEIRNMVIDAPSFLHQAISQGKKVLCEGAQGALLDVDHGTYPFVTSSNTLIGGLLTGLGLPPQLFQHNIGVYKAYCTRVGEGPFPTELQADIGEQLRQKGGEYGATTGRPRRCGWFDGVAAKFTIGLNGITAINLTKLDVLTGFTKIRVATHYLLDGERMHYFPADLNLLERVEVEWETLDGWTEDLSDCKTFEELPQNAKTYVEFLEEFLGVHVKFIGVGQKRDQVIVRD
jgi:adenylosuccinate synthase